jgi:prepilin-type N-terminal cleavage/methylation domain-containing protein
MRRRRSGFTMLEAVVALAIVSLVCVGVLGAYGSALRADVTAAERLTLAALAQERMDQVDMQPTLDRLPDSLARGAFTGLHTGITWTMTTRPVLASAGLYDVAVVVRDGPDAFTLRTRRFRTSSAPGGAQ